MSQMKVFQILTLYLVSCFMTSVNALTAEEIEKLEGNVKLLKEWDYTKYFQYVEEGNRVQIQTDVVKVVGLVENKQFTEIDDGFLNWFNQAFQLISKIKEHMDGGYVLNTKTNIWEKTEVVPGQETTSTEVKSTLDSATIEILERQVRELKEKNYEALLKYVEPTDRERVTTDVGKIITLIDNKQFGDIDEKTVTWFGKIVELLTTINQYIKDGYTYDEATNTWTKTVTETEPSVTEKTVDEVEKNAKELEEWNFEELLKLLEEPDREEAKPIITKVIELVKNKRYAEIDPDLKTKFTRIYKKIREVRPVVKEKVIRQINEIENVDWEKILRELEGVDSNLWTRRIRRVIRDKRERPDEKIEYPWLKGLRRVVRKVYREVKPLHPAQVRRLYRRLRHLKTVNWMRGLRRIRGINHNLWARRIRKVMHHMKHHPNRRMRFRWLGQLRKIVRLVYRQTLPSHHIRPLRRVRPCHFVRVRRPVYNVRPAHFYNVRVLRPYQRVRPFDKK